MEKIKLRNSLLCLALVVFIAMISSVSANGLVINSTNYTVNKTFGFVGQFILRIQNTESYQFLNVSFENNPYVKISTIPSIGSGQILDILANVTTDLPGDYTVKLKGIYLTNVGTSDKTYQLNITSYTANVNPCDFTVIKGDTVIWKNFMQNPISIRNRITNNVIATLINNDSYSMVFSDPLVLPYYLTVGGFGFSYCDLTGIDGSGYVNDPQLDGILNLRVITNYNPTSIALDILNTNYTARVISATDGVMTVRNTGNEIAHNVNLRGDWISFSSNNFTLAQGESKGVIFTIRPSLSDTSSTNKTYSKEISAQGNFNTVSKNISIFVEYANLGNNSTSREDIDYLKNVFCPQYPKSVLCDPEPEVIYKFSNNGSDAEFNITISQEQFRDLWLYVYSLGEEVKTTNNFVKEQINSISSSTSTQEGALGRIENTTLETSKKQESTQTGFITTALIFVGSLVLIVMGGLLFYYNSKKKKEAMRTWK